MIRRYTLDPNEYLSRPVQLYYSVEYKGFKMPGNPDFLNYLKNDFGYYKGYLHYAVSELKKLLREDLPECLNLLGSEYGIDEITICSIPRAKPLEYYKPEQILFYETINSIIGEIKDTVDMKIENGVYYIRRIKPMRTTHLRGTSYKDPYTGPYPGISRDTCEFSLKITNKNILLIDDIYTFGVNIIEDMCQALFDNNAKEVFVYVVAKT